MGFKINPMGYPMGYSKWDIPWDIPFDFSNHDKCGRQHTNAAIFTAFGEKLLL
jgi:hypothetical protein